MEQLWLISLLALLLALAGLGIARWADSHRAPATTEVTHQYLASQVQITPEELSRIVMLPLSELLNVEIYIDAVDSMLRKDPVMMSLVSDKEVFSMRVQDLMLESRPRRNRVDMLISRIYFNTNKKEAIAELT